MGFSRCRSARWWFGYGARAGEENIPPSGPVILAGNHIGAADTFVDASPDHAEGHLPGEGRSPTRRTHDEAGGLVPHGRRAGPVGSFGRAASADGLGPILEVLSTVVWPDFPRVAAPGRRMYRQDGHRVAAPPGYRIPSLSVIPSSPGSACASRGGSSGHHLGRPLDFSEYAWGRTTVPCCGG